MTESSWFLSDEAATVTAGKRLAQAIAANVDDSIIDDSVPALVVYLEGNLGSGKTTFCRGVLQGLGHPGNVKSPTYTLVEPYALPTGDLYHFDLYRLRDPLELEYMGVGDYFNNGFLCLLEWPDRGGGMIPVADIRLLLQTEQAGRRLAWEGMSARGKKVAAAFSPPAK